MAASAGSDVDVTFVTASELYENGRYDIAFVQFLFLANKGDASAMIMVGLMYGAGEGTKVNLAESIRWETMAAEMGETTAMLNLAVSYRETGEVGIALSWLEKALEAGEFEAAIELGKINLPSAPDVARSYLEMAVRSGMICDASQEEALALLGKID